MIDKQTTPIDNPDLTGEDARRMRLLVVSTLLIVGAGLIINLITVLNYAINRNPLRPLDIFQNVALLLFGLFLLLFVQKRRIQLTAWLVVTGLLVLSAVDFLLNSNPPDNAAGVLGLVVAITISVATLNRRSVWTVFLLTILLYTVVNILWLNGLIPARPVIGPEAKAKFAILVWMVAAGVLVAILDSTVKSLREWGELLEARVNERTTELRSALSRVSTILDSSPDVILLLRADGTIEAANKTLQTSLGYDSVDVIDHHPVMLIEAKSQAALSRHITELQRGGRPDRLEVTALRRDGTPLEVDITFVPTSTGDEVTGAVCSLRDISPLKENERLKDVFISSISHELRTPITSLKIYHKLLSLDPGDSSKYLDHLKQETNRLHEIIEWMLLLSQLDQQAFNLDFAPVDLNRLIEHYIVSFRQAAGERKQTVTFIPCEGVLTANVSRYLIGRVFNALLINATSYTPEGGSIHISTGSEQRNRMDSWVMFSVENKGVFIPSEEIDRLFERFYRGSAGRQSGKPGMGLGLAVAKEIVEMHQGRITVQTRADNDPSVRFEVRLPAAGGELHRSI